MQMSMIGRGLLGLAFLNPTICFAKQQVRYCSVVPAPVSNPKTIKVPTPTIGKPCDLSDVIAAAEKSVGVSKGEFETSAAYKVRVVKFMASEVVPGIRLSSPFAVVVAGAGKYLKYDADRQVFTAELPAVIDQIGALLLSLSVHENPSTFSKASYLEVMKDEADTVSEEQTMIGIKFKVANENGNVWALRLQPQPDIGSLIYPAPPAFHVPIADAKEAQEQLGVVFVGVGLVPPVYTETNNEEISLSHPVNDKMTYHELSFHPAVAYVTRLDTGEVLGVATYTKKGRGMFQNAATAKPNVRRSN